MNEASDLTDERAWALFNEIRDAQGGYGAKLFGAFARAVLARAAVPAVPEGWKLVPVEPTRQMQLAAHAATLASYDFMDRGVVPAVYRAMIAAAPQAEARQEQPKQPDSSYSAQPKGEEATERNALAEFNPKLSVVERISLEYPFEPRARAAALCTKGDNDGQA